MNVIETKLKGCFIIEPQIFKDQRGFFYEFYHKDKFEKSTGLYTNFVQDNLARSNYGVIRGLHLQIFPFEQAKLLNVYEGIILDVAVDVREKSLTYGRYVAVELSSKNKKQLFIPKGFLHGYSVLSTTALIGYKTDGFYNREYEKNVCPLDPILNINWKIPVDRIIFSKKDQLAISFNELIKLNKK